MQNKEDKKKFEKIKAKYKKIAEEHGAEIKAVYHITRDELSPSLYENADFSRNTIMDSIKNGELKANEILPRTGWEKCAL
jgi:NTE family protein